MKMMKNSALSPLLLLFLGAACATPASKPPTAETAATFDSAQALADSAVEIKYLLGHDQHRFTAVAVHQEVTAQQYFDRQILKEGQVDNARYTEWLQRVSSFVSTAQGRPAAVAPSVANECRGPFTVTLRVGKETQSANGCRSGEDGGPLAKLARDAEFLLYSRK